MMRLAGLALRRTLPPWLLVGLVVLLALAARAAAGAEPLAGDPGAALRALARQNVWSLLFLAAPLLWLHAARTGTDDANAWLAPLPAPPLALAAARLSGIVLALATATLVTAVIAETAVAADARGWRRVRLEPSPARVLDDAEPRVRWTIPGAARGEEARLAVTVAPGAGPAVTARFRATGATEARTVEARVSGRTRLALELPPGAMLTLELERAGAGALLVLPDDALEIVGPLPGERGAALALGVRAFLLLASAAALAAGLARFLRPALAAGVVLALALAACTGPAALSRWVPGADLPRAWSELARGLVPAMPPASAWIGALVLALLGLALQARRTSSPATEDA